MCFLRSFLKFFVFSDVTKLFFLFDDSNNNNKECKKQKKRKRKKREEVNAVKNKPLARDIVGPLVLRPFPLANVT